MQFLYWLLRIESSIKSKNVEALHSFLESWKRIFTVDIGGQIHMFHFPNNLCMSRIITAVFPIISLSESSTNLVLQVLNQCRGKEFQAVTAEGDIGIVPGGLDHMLLTRGRVFTSLLLPLTLPGPSERLGRPDENRGNFNAVEDCLSISIRPTTTAHPSHPSFVAMLRILLFLPTTFPVSEDSSGQVIIRASYLSPEHLEGRTFIVHKSIPELSSPL